MQKVQNKNVTAVFIGLFLVALIALFTIYRTKIFKNADRESSMRIVTRSSNTQKPEFILSSAELLDKMKTGGNFTIIDTRVSDDFKKEHILDAKNVPLDNISLELPALQKEKTYVIIDDGSGSGLLFAKDIFPRSGIRKVFYLDGGLPGWKEGGGPVISSGDPSLLSDQSKVNYIKSSELQDMLAKGDNLTIVDLRSKYNYDQGHIQGAINIFIDNLEKERAKIPVGKKTILYDKDGLWAFRGTVRLFDMGIFNVFCLSDGLDGWQQNKYLLVK